MEEVVEVDREVPLETGVAPAASTEPSPLTRNLKVTALFAAANAAAMPSRPAAPFTIRPGSPLHCSVMAVSSASSVANAPPVPVCLAFWVCARATPEQARQTAMTAAALM